MEGSSSTRCNIDLFVDDFYFSALYDNDEILPISDELYAEELQLKEALISSSAISSRIKNIKIESLKMEDTVKGEREKEDILFIELAKNNPNCKFYVEKALGCTLDAI